MASLRDKFYRIVFHAPFTPFYEKVLALCQYTIRAFSTADETKRFRRKKSRLSCRGKSIFLRFAVNIA